MLNSRDNRSGVYAGMAAENTALILVLIGLVIVSAGLGYIRIPYVDVVRIMFDAIMEPLSAGAGIDPVHRTVVTDVRLPRILTAAAVGGGLALSGAVYQGILLNPLADPFTLGISAGAAFGASVAILFFPALNVYVLPLCAFSGAAAALAAVIVLSVGSAAGSATGPSAGSILPRGGWSAGNLILSGIIVSSILSAGISFLKFLADEQVAVIIFWLMGGFASRTWLDVGIVSSVAGVGFILVYYFARDLNVIALGDRTVATLGVETRRVTLILLLAASLITAVCVSVSGIIGFVGLLVPHMTRFVTGPDNRRLLPVCFTAGGILLLAADTAARALLPSEIPIGVLTALIGGPVFCWIFRKSRTRSTI